MMGMVMLIAVLTISVHDNNNDHFENNRNSAQLPAPPAYLSFENEAHTCSARADSSGASACIDMLSTPATSLNANTQVKRTCFLAVFRFGRVQKAILELEGVVLVWVLG